MNQNALIAAVRALLLANFPGGFYLDPLGLKQLRKLAAEQHRGLPEDDAELERLVRMAGVLDSNRVYVIGLPARFALKSAARQVLARQGGVAYYAPLAASLPELPRAGLGLVRLLLEGVLSHCGFAEEYFTAEPTEQDETQLVKSALLKVWGEAIGRTLAELGDLLPFVPTEIVKRTLQADADFIADGREAYAWLGALDMSDGERTEFREAVAEQCRLNGHASAADLPLPCFDGVNSDAARLTAAFRLSGLDGEYVLKGAVISPKSGGASGVTGMVRDYCRSHECCTLTELVKLATPSSANGGAAIQTALNAAYSTMVRLDEETFIAAEGVEFDTAAIDAELDRIVAGRCVPLRSVAFGLFPGCGHPWTTSLLESFLELRSQRFYWGRLAVNSQHLGAVVRRPEGYFDCKRDYEDALIEAMRREQVPPTVGSVTAFLTGNGYMKSVQPKRAQMFVAALSQKCLFDL